MLNSLQIEMLISALAIFILISFFLSRNRMSVKNSIMWLLVPVVFALVAIFLDPIAEFSAFLGFEVLSNFIFVIIIGSLLLICFFLTINLSKQQDQITKLIQEVSILKKNKKNDKKK